MVIYPVSGYFFFGGLGGTPRSLVCCKSRARAGCFLSGRACRLFGSVVRTCPIARSSYATKAYKLVYTCGKACHTREHGRCIRFSGGQHGVGRREKLASTRNMPFAKCARGSLLTPCWSSRDHAVRRFSGESAGARFPPLFVLACEHTLGHQTHTTIPEARPIEAICLLMVIKPADRAFEARLRPGRLTRATSCYCKYLTREQKAESRVWCCWGFSCPAH